MRAVEDTLKPLVTGLDGELHIATDPEHAVELLVTSPAKWRVILGWPGWGDHPQGREGMGTHRLYAIVQVAKGLTIDPARMLHRGRPSLPGPMMGLLETVSTWFRAMRFPNGCGFDCAGFALVGSAWLEIEDVETKQHQLDFEIQAALPVHSVTLPVSITPIS